MASAAIPHQSQTGEKQVIPVRGNRFRDWLARLGKRLSFEGLKHPPRSTQFRTDEQLRIEVALPGFRARDTRVECSASHVEIRAERTELRKAGRSERRSAQLLLSLDDDVDAAEGSAEFRKGSLSVRFPLRESAKVRRIPIRSR